MKKNITSQRRKVEELLEFAWLELEDYNVNMAVNPLRKKDVREVENPAYHLLRILRDPENFHFTCKYVFNIDILPFQCVILKELWVRKYPMLIGSRGLSKTFLLALYSTMRAALSQGSKVVLVGGAFRQSKQIFEYCENIWNNAPVLRSMVDSMDRTQKPRHDIDRVVMKIGYSTVTGIPIGDGQKIRGLRATHLITDEFDSVPEEIYEVVVSGFAAVSANPVQKVKDEAKKKFLKSIGEWTENMENEARRDFGNQAVLSGTASYEFKHFCKYWKRYKAIIESRGDNHKLMEIFNGEVPANFNWKHYSVMRIPHDLLPAGFMDEQHISRSKATVHSGLFNMEYGAVFITDTEGFFRRSLIESCVTNKDIRLPVSGLVKFSAMLRGQKDSQYVIAIDPASETNNLAIVILEVCPDHRKVVFCWTTNRSKHKDLIKRGLAEEHDYYRYCVRKIRSILASFNIVRIVLDKQGGGVAIEEALQDPKQLMPEESLIWQTVVIGEPKESDMYVGEHILEIFPVSKGDVVSQANHGLKKDMEDKTLLFPYFDPLSIEFAIAEDKAAKRDDVDTLEDCLLEIEELKNELSIIEHSVTGLSGRERWDTPEIKMPGGRKGKLCKDRYSALLMANWAARTLQNTTPTKQEHNSVGGFANLIHLRSKGDALYVGAVPPALKASINYGAVIRR